jgi:hypothetical protein
MSASTTVVFLHGIRDDDPDARWREALEAALARSGQGTLKGAGFLTVAPSWLAHLEGDEPATDLDAPPMTYVRGSEAEHRKAAGDYYLQISDLEATLDGAGRPSAGLLAALPPDWAGKVVTATLLTEVEAYIKSARRRNACLHAVLDQLPDEGEIVLVAHSLGSVLAADLLYALPPAVTVRLVVTIGSPLSLTHLRDHLLRSRDRFPFERIGPWLNVVGVYDPVTAGRGIGRVLPEVLDAYVSTPLNPDTVHAARSYLDQDVVTRAIQWVFDTDRRRSTSTASPEISLPSWGPQALGTFQYALRLEQGMSQGDRRDRFGQARRLLAGDVATTWRETGESAPVADRLAADNAGLIRGSCDPEEVTKILLSLAMGNPISPFEVRYEDGDEARALRALSRDFGHLADRADIILAAEGEARRDHKASMSWTKRTAMAAGVVALIAAPYMVAAAAPAGLAGGAGLVAGLAALGPGGMLGGLGMVGLVGGAGGAAVASALTSGSAEVVEQRVIYLHALAYAGRSLHEPGHARRVWATLLDMEKSLISEHSRLAAFSDSRAAVLKELDAKRATVRRALDALARQGLGPKALTE